MSANNDGFLSRWSQRKAQVRESDALELEAEAEARALEDSQRKLLADPDQRDTPPDDETRQRWIEELEQIDVDALSYDSDFTIFMKGWVPNTMRKRALRKLWTTNPSLAVLDGLNDYDLDYTDKAVQAGTVISSWSAQGGYSKLEELAERVAGTDADEDGAAGDDIPVFEGDADVQAEAGPDEAHTTAKEDQQADAGTIDGDGTADPVEPPRQPV